MSPISTELRQWCPECLRATESIPCDLCGGQTVTCAECGGHPECIGPEDDSEAEYADEENDDE